MYTEIDLRPYKINQATNTEVYDSLPAFGVGSAIISEGVYVVGTQVSNNLYTFRPRAQGWTPLATGSTTTATLAPNGEGRHWHRDRWRYHGGRRDYDGRGAAFVYTTGSGSRYLSQQAVLQSLDGRNGDQFGDSVGVSGDTVIVGAPAAGDDRKGRAYIFQRLGSTWTQVKELAGAGGPGTTFGSAVAIDGNTAVVGDAGSNRSYVYTFDGSDWKLVDTIGDELAGVCRWLRLRHLGRHFRGRDHRGCPDLPDGWRGQGGGVCLCPHRIGLDFSGHAYGRRRSCDRPVRHRGRHQRRACNRRAHRASREARARHTCSS